MPAKKITKNVAGNGAVLPIKSENRIAKHLTDEVIDASKLVIKPLKEKVLSVSIQGTAPLMMLRFSQKAIRTIMENHRAGSAGKSKKKREARDFEQEFKDASYVMADGSGYGIPAISFKHALTESGRLVDYKMTLLRQSVFVEADGFDKFDAQPLVRIISPSEPEMTVMPVRNASGVMDLRARPMWREWGCELRIRFDTDRFSLDDVVNLLVRAGAQNGIGEGRVNSKNGPGPGYGAFRVVIPN